ncbi:MAG: dihydropteroate synthase [Pseudomonadota bacterium]
MHWQTTRFRIDLGRPQVMGIVNVTPDSFSDGGLHASTAAAISHCERLLAEGADILDIGGESTRPGSLPVSADEEMARVLPVLDAALALGCPVSIDTRNAQVMAAVLARGADIVNDIHALQRQSELLTLGRPLLVGWSRKSTLGAITGRAVGQRQFASVAAALAAVQRGARIVRVHDVAATVDALKVWQAAGLPAG